ncbi:MAG: ribonuclease H-like domain-containing protein [Spirochaetales bacterium]|nr:ribonuclease H-like domain-containing protein [Spirochaetales bacterium]
MRKGSLSSRLSALKAGRQEAEKLSSQGRTGKVSGTGAEERGKGEKGACKTTSGVFDSGEDYSFPFPGWEKVSDFVFRKTTIFNDLQPPVPGMELKKIYAVDQKDNQNQGPNKSPNQYREPNPAGPNKNLIFFDLETTGLSGGAGNIAFLAGVGFYSQGQFTLIQLFLQDYPGEREFLLELMKLMPESSVWVSYNGKSFDTSLLKTRLLMNGEQPVIGENLDLLYPSRRLWRTILPDCSLGTLEVEIFKKRRALDIPGSQIPDIYFNYLKNREASNLERVFAHHLEDIVSLLKLYNLLGEIFSGVENPEKIPVDPAGLGGLLLTIGERRAPRILEEGLSCGNRKCGLILADYYKRCGDRNTARGIWKQLWDEKTELIPGLELAKELEHRRGDYGQALRIVDTLLSGDFDFTVRIKEGLLHRRVRLNSKIDRNASEKNI